MIRLIHDGSFGRLLMVESPKTLFILFFAVFDCTDVADEGCLKLHLLHFFEIKRVRSRRVARLILLHLALESCNWVEADFRLPATDGVIGGTGRFYIIILLFTRLIAILHELLLAVRLAYLSRLITAHDELVPLQVIPDHMVTRTLIEAVSWAVRRNILDIDSSWVLGCITVVDLLSKLGLTLPKSVQINGSSHN